MAQAANARNDNPVSRLRVSLLDSLVGSDTRAKQRRRLDEIQTFRQTRDVGGRREHVRREATVNRVAGVLLRLAQRFPARQAKFTFAAGAVQPGHANSVALLQGGNSSAELVNKADRFVAGDKR